MSRRYRLVALLVVALVGLLSATTAPALERAVPLIDAGAQASESAVRLRVDQPPPSLTGFDSLFIGHSFFIPVIARMSFHGPNAGFFDHSQTTVFSGGATGAPQALWENPTKRSAIQAVLDDGDIELFGMTYHPNYPTLDGYRTWVEYALARNPSTRFFVAFPWLTDPATRDAATYRAVWEGALDTIATDIIDDLRLEYPGTEFSAIPYGQAAVELYALFEAGSLPDVDMLVSAAGDGVFRDDFGHAGPILRELAALVFLGAIYGVELASYDYDAGYSIDLRTIAGAIIDDRDPRSTDHGSKGFRKGSLAPLDA